jgi:hypothetical protein
VHDSSYALVIKTTWRMAAQDACIALVKKLNDPHDKYTRGDSRTGNNLEDGSYRCLHRTDKKTGRLTMHRLPKRLLLSRH